MFDEDNSDRRNRSLQKMFQMIGTVEQAGSENILRAWRKPLLRELIDPEYTVLELSMMSLIPPEAIEELHSIYGDVFDGLPETQRLALATASIEGRVTNQRLRELSEEPPRDLTRLLRELVDGGLLSSDGTGRGTYYTLAREGEQVALPHREEAPPLFDWSSTHPATSVPTYTPAFEGRFIPGSPSSTQEEENSTHSAESSTQEKESSTQEEEIRAQKEHLRAIAEPVRNRRTAPRELVSATILKLWTGRYLALHQLADLLGRQVRTLRTHYIPGLVAEGHLEMRYPNVLNHPRQAYRTVAPDPGQQH